MRSAILLSLLLSFFGSLRGQVVFSPPGAAWPDETQMVGLTGVLRLSSELWFKGGTAQIDVALAEKRIYLLQLLNKQKIVHTGKIVRE